MNQCKGLGEGFAGEIISVGTVREAEKDVWVEEGMAGNLAAARSGPKEDSFGKEIHLKRDVEALNSWFRSLGFLLARVPKSMVLEIILDHV